MSWCVVGVVLLEEGEFWALVGRFVDYTGSQSIPFTSFFRDGWCIYT